jgi:hypothetical protein
MLAYSSHITENLIKSKTALFALKLLGLVLDMCMGWIGLYSRAVFLGLTYFRQFPTLIVDFRSSSVSLRFIQSCIAMYGDRAKKS